METLDPDITSVEYNKGSDCLMVRFGFGEFITMTKGDLTTLSRFLEERGNKR